MMNNLGNIEILIPYTWKDLSLMRFIYGRCAEYFWGRSKALFVIMNNLGNIGILIPWT